MGWNVFVKQGLFQSPELGIFIKSMQLQFLDSFASACLQEDWDCVQEQVHGLAELETLKKTEARV